MQRLPALKRGASSNLQPRAFFLQFFWGKHGRENVRPVENSSAICRDHVRSVESHKLSLIHI